MALRVAIDSNAYIELCRGDARRAETIRRAREVFVPFVVLGELRAGFHADPKARANERMLQRFLQAERVAALFADEGTTHVYAGLFARLRQAGTPMPTNDLWIAALVVQHDLTLMSADRHFDRIPEIPRI